MEVLINLYDYHTKLFKNSLADISDKDAQNRLGTRANHIAWIAGSLVYQRQVLANAMDIDVKQTSEDLFKAGKGEGHKSIQAYKIILPTHHYQNISRTGKRFHLL